MPLRRADASARSSAAEDCDRGRGEGRAVRPRSPSAAQAAQTSAGFARLDDGARTSERLATTVIAPRRTVTMPVASSAITMAASRRSSASDGSRAPQGDQGPVPLQHGGVARAGGARPSRGLAAPKVAGILGIGNVLRASSRRRRTPRRRPRARPGQIRVAVVGEVRERRRRGPLLALEQQRHERGGEHQGGGDLLARRGT